jgi:hypothetical protein
MSEVSFGAPENKTVSVDGAWLKRNTRGKTCVGVMKNMPFDWLGYLAPQRIAKGSWRFSAGKRCQSRTRRVVAPSTSDWTSWLQQFVDDTLLWRQRVLHVFGEGQISSRSRSFGLWLLGSGVERSIGVVEDADPSRTGECQQQRVVEPLELVQIQSIPPTRCVPALLLRPAAAVICATWHGSPRAQCEMATCLLRRCSTSLTKFFKLQGATLMTFNHGVDQVLCSPVGCMCWRVLA